MIDNGGYKVPLTKILKIVQHNGSDFLDFATVYGFRVICGRESYKENDLCISDLRECQENQVKDLLKLIAEKEEKILKRLSFTE